MKNGKIFLIFAVIFFLLSLIFLRHHFSIFYFQNDTNKIALNVEVKENAGEFFACFDKNCDKMTFEKGIYSYALNQENPLFYNGRVKNIEIISKNPEAFRKIIAISVFSGNDFKYFTFQNLKTEPVEFQNVAANRILLPYSPLDKTILQKIAVYFESIFYNWYFYFFSYIFILLFLKYGKFCFDFNAFKIPKFLPLLLIILLGFLLRYSHIDFIPLWNDELYTLHYISAGGLNLKRIIADPGNPPLFFLFSNLWLLKFNFSTAAIRFLPLLIGLFQIYSVYFVLNRLLSRKAALISAFLSAINIFIIVESNEIRSYILSMTLVLWGSYFFFRLYKDFSFKNWLFYLLISILLINTHFYTLFYVFSNFLAGIVIFSKNWLKFLFLNFAAFLTFIPYFQTTVMNTSFGEEFNSWLEKPDFQVLYNHIIFYFGNWVFFLLIVAFCVFAYKKYLKNSLCGKIFIYNIFSIAAVFIFAYLISLFVKPVLFERYFCIFLPLLIVNTAILLTIPYKNHFLALFIFLFSINAPKYENFNLFSNIDFMMRYSAFDFKNSSEESFFVVPDMQNYAKHYPEIPAERVIVSNFGVREDKNLEEVYIGQIKKKKLKSNLKGKKVLLYLPEICTNSKIKYSKSENIKKIETTILPVYKIFLDLW